MKNQLSNHSPSKGMNHAAKSTAESKLMEGLAIQLEQKLEQELLESGISKNLQNWIF